MTLNVSLFFFSVTADGSTILCSAVHSGRACRLMIVGSSGAGVGVAKIAGGAAPSTKSRLSTRFKESGLSRMPACARAGGAHRRQPARPRNLQECALLRHTDPPLRRLRFPVRVRACAGDGRARADAPDG